MTAEQFDKVCELIEEGNQPPAAAMLAGVPFSTFYHRVMRDDEARDQYDTAMAVLAEVVASSVFDDNSNTNPALAAQRLKATQWYLSVQKPDKFAPQRNVNHKHTLDGDSLARQIAEANARLLPIRDQPRVIESQALDVTPQSDQSAFDSQSVAPDLADVQDIDFSADKIFE